MKKLTNQIVKEMWGSWTLLYEALNLVPHDEEYQTDKEFKFPVEGGGHGVGAPPVVFAATWGTICMEAMAEISKVLPSPKEAGIIGRAVTYYVVNHESILSPEATILSRSAVDRIEKLAYKNLM